MESQRSQPLLLGRLTLRSPFLLAPLESVSDASFRRVCFELGASFTFTEMIRASALARENRSTVELIDTFDADVPCGLQLLAANERELQGALEVVERLAFGSHPHPHLRNIRAVDLNLACPSPDVLRIGAGAALLKRRAKVRALFETLAKFRRGSRLDIAAIGAKLRLGANRLEQERRVFVPVVEAAAGALDYVTVHARHARQTSDEPPSWEALALARERSPVPLLGSGGLLTADDARRLVAQTGCAGALIARGAIRSPWIFRALADGGPGLPSEAELGAVEAAYFARASALGAKPKFLAWHREGFYRLRRRVTGGDGAEPSDRGGSEGADGPSAAVAG